MNLLIFFALPLATILLAIVFEKILKSPVLVAITFFAVYLIILFALFAAGVITNLASGLIAIIVYTILAFLVASIIQIVREIWERFNRCCPDRCNENNCYSDNSNDTNVANSNNGDLLRINCRCNNGNSQNLLTVNSSCLNSREREIDCECSGGNNEGRNNNDRANNGITLTGNIIPNQSNCGRTGFLRGCYRRW